MEYPYVETTIIMFLYLFIGYIIDPHDVLLINMDFSLLTILLAIITLFHGVSSGFLAMVILAFAIEYFYTEFKYIYYLKEFVLVMIYGEFHFYWNRIIDYYTTEDKYTKQKLSELSKAFYMLKISHDQIEKSYVVKPMSLRNSIFEIKEAYDRDKSNNLYQEFLLLLQKTLNIESAYLLAVERDEKMRILAQTDKNEIIDIEDLLIKDTFIKKIPLYVSAINGYSRSKYLATIPTLSNKKIIALLVISKMPFMSFNKDTLISATILVNYMFDEMHKMEIMKEMENFLPNFQSDFRFESYRLYNLNKKFGTETTVLLFKSYSQLNSHLLLELVQKNLRTLDVMSHIKRDDFEIIAILFPFADSTSVDGFVDRIYSFADIADTTASVKHTNFSIEDIALIEEYMRDAI